MKQHHKALVAVGAVVGGAVFWTPLAIAGLAYGLWLVLKPRP